MKTLYFIRHGESLANAWWIWNGDFRHIPLTDYGHKQAEQVAGFLPKPDLILHTIYTRTRETAEPFIQKHPDVPVETIPMHEFTYLNTQTYNGTTMFERREKALSYWKANNPRHNDGGWAESFVDCLERVYVSLDILAHRKEEIIVIFSHGQILQLTRLLLEHENETKNPEDLMRLYREIETKRPLKNCEILKLEIQADTWWTMESVFVPKN